MSLRFSALDKLGVNDEEVRSDFVIQDVKLNFGLGPQHILSETGLSQSKLSRGFESLS
jgi:hypothetical protein